MIVDAGKMPALPEEVVILAAAFDALMNRAGCDESCLYRLFAISLSAFSDKSSSGIRRALSRFG